MNFILYKEHLSGLLGTNSCGIYISRMCNERLKLRAAFWVIVNRNLNHGEGTMKAPPVLQADHVEVLSALENHRQLITAVSTYNEMLNRHVFPHILPGHDRKQQLSYKKLLEQFDTYEILFLIWKESSFVSEEALIQAAMGKSYTQNEMSVHRIGVDVSDCSQDVSKNVSWIRSIVIAAEAFNLVKRIEISKTKVSISATSVLHNFMKEFGNSAFSSNICRDVENFAINRLIASKL